MITTREFFEHDAEDIINNIESIYSVQREESNKYLFEPFPSKDELLDKYEAGLDSPYEDLSDIDNLSDEEQSTIITEQKARISNVYNKIQKERNHLWKQSANVILHIFFTNVIISNFARRF